MNYSSQLLLPIATVNCYSPLTTNLVGLVGTFGDSVLSVPWGMGAMRFAGDNTMGVRKIEIAAKIPSHGEGSMSLS